MKKAIVVMLIILGGIGWVIYGTSKNTREDTEKKKRLSRGVVQQLPKDETKNEPKEALEDKIKAELTPEEIKDIQSSIPSYSDWSSAASSSGSPFPPPVVEEVDGEKQRTIHVGVRQWEWVPIKMNANYGERVVLIMHNADVPHSISIPDLNVRQDIPDDGAVVQFVASKRGTFTFFCDTPCGKDHDKMKGTIIIV